MKELDDIIAPDFTPRNVCLWTGAGVSVDPPSNLPVGNNLTKAYVETYSLQGTWKKICDYFINTKMVDSIGNPKIAPRLESILENLIEIYGLECLKSLEPMFYAQPNLNHFIFANHLILGGVHITTNFDSCIQNALNVMGELESIQAIQSSQDHTEHSNLNSNRLLLHIHGRYSQSDIDLNNMGLRISKIANGVLSPFDALIERILLEKKYIVFLGYSGSDYFDVNPFFHTLNQKGIELKQLEVIWINHTSGDRVQKVMNWKEKGKFGQVILESIEQVGGRVLYLEINTRYFLEYISSKWGLDLDALKYHINYSDENKTIDDSFSDVNVPHHLQLITSVKIFSFMGIGKEVVKEKEALGLTLSLPECKKWSPTVIFLLSNGFRDTGLYKAAIKYSKMLPKQSLKEILLREGRLAGDNWLRGSNLLAAFHFFRGQLLFLIKRNAEEVPLGIYEEFLLDFLHWYRDLGRNRIVRKILPLSFAISAFNFFVNNQDYLYSEPHAIGKLDKLIKEIPGLENKVNLPDMSINRASSDVSIFQETDSLLGVINFTRRDLQRKYQSEKEIPRKDDLFRLMNMSAAIEDRPGQLKTAQLLKLFYGITPTNWLRTIWEVEWTWGKKIGWFISVFIR